MTSCLRLLRGRGDSRSESFARAGRRVGRRRRQLIGHHNVAESYALRRNDIGVSGGGVGRRRSGVRVSKKAPRYARTSLAALCGAPNDKRGRREDRQYLNVA